MHPHAIGTLVYKKLPVGIINNEMEVDHTGTFRRSCSLLIWAALTKLTLLSRRRQAEVDWLPRARLVLGSPPSERSSKTRIPPHILPNCATFRSMILPPTEGA